MKWPKSIRWRLQLWQAFLLAGLLSGFGFTAFQLYRTNRLSQIDEELEQRVAALTSDVRRPPKGPPPFPRDPLGEGTTESPRPFPGGVSEPWFANRIIALSPYTQTLFDETATNGFYYAIWFRNDTLLKRSTNAPPNLRVPRSTVNDSSVQIRSRGACREAYLATELGDIVLVGRSVLADLAAQRRFAAWLIGAGLAVMAIGLGGGWVIISHAIHPVEAISASASRISAGNLTERIPVRETDGELGRLAGVLNSTFARLETAFNQQRQFTADASHELRTPIAVLLSETQTALSRNRSPAEYRETIEACQNTVQQMRRLTESLLDLARFDAGQERMREDPLDLAELARDCVEIMRSLARERRIQIRLDLHPAETLGDLDRLRQVLVNLLTNAIHYNHEAGEVSVATGVLHGKAILRVTDTGMGIAEDKLPQVFDRFYRADPARSRAQSRTGLGLAISKAIIDAHQGMLEVSSECGVGSTFTVVLRASNTRPS